MTAGALGGAIAAVVSGAAVKYTGRLTVLTTGFMSQIAFLVWMFVWQADYAYKLDLYVMAAGLGSVVSLITSQITGM